MLQPELIWRKRYILVLIRVSRKKGALFSTIEILIHHMMGILLEIIVIIVYSYLASNWGGKLTVDLFCGRESYCPDWAWMLYFFPLSTLVNQLVLYNNHVSSPSLLAGLSFILDLYSSVATLGCVFDSPDQSSWSRTLTVGPGTKLLGCYIYMGYLRYFKHLW